MQTKLSLLVATLACVTSTLATPVMFGKRSTSFNKWGGLESLDNFDEFFGPDNFGGLKSPPKSQEIQVESVQCRSSIKTQQVQQQLAIVKEFVKKLLVEQVCEVEVQTILISQFVAGIEGFSVEVVSGRTVTFDNSVANQIKALHDQNGNVSPSIIHLSGKEIGKKRTSAKGSNRSSKKARLARAAAARAAEQAIKESEKALKDTIKAEEELLKGTSNEDKNKKLSAAEKKKQAAEKKKQAAEKEKQEAEKKKQAAEKKKQASEKKKQAAEKKKQAEEKKMQAEEKKMQAEEKEKEEEITKEEGEGESEGEVFEESSEEFEASSEEEESEETSSEESSSEELESEESKSEESKSEESKSEESKSGESKSGEKKGNGFNLILTRSALAWPSATGLSQKPQPNTLFGA